MRDFIQRMYHAIQEGNVELFDDIEEDIKRGNIELSLEDIVPLCKMTIIDSEYIEYSQIIEIVRMTLWAVEKGDMKEGIKEFVKGLEEIYNEGQKDTWKNWYGFSYEEFKDREKNCSGNGAYVLWGNECRGAKRDLPPRCCQDEPDNGGRNRLRLTYPQLLLPNTAQVVQQECGKQEQTVVPYPCRGEPV